MARRASGPITIDGLEDLEPLGHGGFSQVYRARQTDFDRLVAVKVLDVGLDDRQRSAFERECRAMGVVSQHPNIVTVLSSAYASDGRPAIVMELYRGGTLAERVAREGPLTSGKALEVGIRISAALQTAHERGLLHRDVKPQNLFVSEYGEPALGDFGISSHVDEAGGSRGLTVHYAAPEVIEDREPGPAADVYALAATLYTLIAGRRPFADTGGSNAVADIALRILSDPPPRIGGRCPPQLEAALLRGLAKRPEDRPASAASFGRLLQEVQDQLGAQRTPLTVAMEASTDPDSRTLPGLDDDAGATIARASTARTDPVADAEDDPAARASRRRRLMSLAAGAVVVAGTVVVGATVLSGGLDRGVADTEPPEAIPVDPAVAGDDFLVRVDPPADVEVVRSQDGGIEVRWEPNDRLSYEVERVDADGRELDPVAASDGQGTVALIDVEDETAVCVVVRAISQAGQISAPSPPACLGG